jgi:hypothetical protein
MHTATTKHETSAQVPSPAWEQPTSPEWARLARVTCEELPGAWEASLDDPEVAPALTTQPWEPTRPVQAARAPEDIIPF